MKRVRELVALCERVIVDMRDAIVAIERGDADAVAEKFEEAGRRIADHAKDLATDPKEGQQQ